MKLAFGYTDAETGFQYLRARYYDPATGQFLSRDPLVALTGSAYGYVDGNPLNGTDPSGLCLIGRNPNGSCRGSNLKNDLATTGAVLATGAVIVGTFVAPEVVIPIIAVTAETATTGAGVAAVLISTGVTIVDCHHDVNATCLYDAVGTVTGALGVAGGVIGRTTGALATGELGELAEPLRTLSNAALAVFSAGFTVAGLFGDQLSGRKDC